LNQQYIKAMFCCNASVQATDTARTELIAWTLASITISDINDQIPTFNSPTYNASLVEYSPDGTPLILNMDVSVIDMDEVSQSCIYKLTRRESSLHGQLSYIHWRTLVFPSELTDWLTNNCIDDTGKWFHNKKAINILH